MSWFSDITGKAENLLTRLDKSAASALHTDDHSTPTPHEPTYPPDNYSYHSSLAYSASVPANLSALKQSNNAVAPAVKKAPRSTNSAHAPSQSTKDKVDSDDMLFAFLNSNEGGFAKNESSVSRHSRQSSTSSAVSGKSTKSIDDSKHRSSSMLSDAANSIVSSGATIDTNSPALESLTNEATLTTSSNSDPMLTLERENWLMKTELSSLNQEMTSVIQRAKDSHDEVVRLKEKIHGYNHTASHADQMVRELQARETDLTQALAAKDSQLAVLRVRLEEADRSLNVRLKTVEGLQTDKHRILQDQSDSTGIHNQAMDSLRDKLAEAERALARGQEASSALKDEGAQRQQTLEAQHKSLTDALTATQKQLNDEKARCNQLNNQIRSCKSNLGICRQELTDYKDKASRILQSKERLIASLREGPGASGESVGVSQLEYDAVKQERDMFREDLQQYKMTVDNYKLEIQDTEVGHQAETETLHDTVTSLEELLGEEKRRNTEVGHELNSQKLETRYSVEELNRQKASMQTRIDEREREIERLRTQVTTKSLSCVTETELESRIRALTESLIHKQTTLEALSTEKTSLTMQLERLNQKYQELQSMPVRSSTTVNVTDDDDVVRSRGGGFLREQIGDATVTRKMKRAANTIDKFSVRLGVFLRRYPIARVFVIIYMAFLHVWVTFVLLTYQPEIHGDPQHKPPSPK